VLFWVPMLGGTLLLFFGHVEVYALPAAGLLAYFRALLARAQLGRRPWLPPLLLGVSIALHATAVMLVPTLFFTGSRRRWPRDLALLAAVPLAVWGFLFLHQYDGRLDPGLVGSFQGSAGQSPFLPWFRKPPALYGLLDRCHWLDVANTALLVGGAAFPLLVAGGRAAAPRGFRFALGWSALAWLALALVDNVSYPKSGDWDLFALGAVPLTIWAALRFDGGPRAAAVVIALALLHSVPWAGARLFPDRARRLEEHRLLARAYFALERTAPALEHHLELRRLGVRDPEVLNALGALLLASGRSAEAETVFLEVTTAWPGHFAAWKNLGLLYFDRKDHERSRRALDRAVRLERDDAEAQLYLGKAAYACRDWAAAAEALERALRLRGDDVSGWVVLAQAQLGLRRYDDAERAGHEGLERAPRHELLLRMMADLAGRRGDEAARARHLAALAEVEAARMAVEGPEKKGPER
jgi:tetratricopeptide (TPR) repeat protein